MNECAAGPVSLGQSTVRTLAGLCLSNLIKSTTRPAQKRYNRRQQQQQMYDMGRNGNWRLAYNQDI